MSLSPPRATVTHPAFVNVNNRRLFTLEIAPAGPSKGTVLYLPPYAEEMNRCRCHVAESARALAAAGQRCLILDHHGTGESDGGSTEADWENWKADAIAVAQGLVKRDRLPLTLWGMRTGALLATEVAHAGVVDVDRLLLWQPVLDGKNFLTQYLRLRIASQMVHGSDRETTAMIMQRLAVGEDIEVAGYPLAQRLAAGLSSRRLIDFATLKTRRIDWVEIVAQANQNLPPGSQRAADALTAAGANLRVTPVAAPQIWQLAGEHPAPQLIRTTVDLMGEVA
jgi:exosortase A-associated hydrolase 2